jgi:hypothetical protein
VTKKLGIGLIFLLIGLLSSCNRYSVGIKEGNGTENNPFIIRTYDDLYHLNNSTMYYYELGNDIYNTDQVVINITLGSFFGHLDGKGYTIHDIVIQNPDGHASEYQRMYVGLFDILRSEASIKNINFDNIEIDIDYNYLSFVGSIVGYMEKDSSIEEVSVNGSMSIHLNNGTIGGIVGKGKEITNCYSDIDITAYGDDEGLTIGGIVGNNDLKVLRSEAVGDMTFNGSIDEESNNKFLYMGGIAGFSFGDILYSTNETNMIANRTSDESTLQVRVGGIAGIVFGLIEYSISLGAIDMNTTDYVNAGGLAGYVMYEGSIMRSLAITPIGHMITEENNLIIGGVVGYAFNGNNITELYYCEEIGFNKMVGNYDNSELEKIENHTQNYYLSGIELEYIGNKFIYEEGKLPKVNE